MRKLLATLALIAISTTATAQTIHNHPQKAAYASPAEYPPFSGQAHWLLPDGMLTHVHADLQCPYLAEVTGPVTCKFSVTLHHFEGHVKSVDLGYHTLNNARDIVWDATGSSTPPVMVGDPNATLVWTGHFTADLPSNVVHWWYLINTVKAEFNNGDAIMARLLVPIWSPNEPQLGAEVLEGFLPFLSSRAEVTSVAHPDFSYGATTAEYVGLFPIMPISTPWPTAIQYYSYGSHNLPAATNEVRRDLDLHHDVPGVTLFQRTQVDDLGIGFAIDAFNPPGPHKVALMRFQPNAEELLASLLVGVMTMDPNAPPSPPVICVPPQVLENGACVSPPPPPPPPAADEWVEAAPTFQQFKSGGVLVNRYKICTPTGCKEIQ